MGAIRAWKDCGLTYADMAGDRAGPVAGEAADPDCCPLESTTENWRRVIVKAFELTAMPVQAYTEAAKAVNVVFSRSAVGMDLRRPSGASVTGA